MKPDRFRWAPAVTLLVLAPLCAEALQGATRPSTYVGVPLVFLFEVAGWGGGALLARELVRRRGLGWVSMLSLGVVVSLVEEIFVLQTSIAPLVVQIKGVVYARASGLNYLYLLWAVAYEAVFAVIVPVTITELLFSRRSRASWLSRTGIAILLPFMLVGGVGTWFSWTQIARTRVFHQAPYSPDPLWLLIGALACTGLVWFAFRQRPEQAGAVSSGSVPAPMWCALMGGSFALILQAAVLLAFGIAPQVPPAAATGALAVFIAACLHVGRSWVRRVQWSDAHSLGLTSGALVGNMLAGYSGYIGATPLDFWGKTVLDVLALTALIGFLRHWLAGRFRRESAVSN